MPGCLDPVGFFLYFLQPATPALPSATTPWSWGCLEITEGYFCAALAIWMSLEELSFTCPASHQPLLHQWQQRCRFKQPEARLQCTVWFISLFFCIHTASVGSINAERITGIESLLLKGCIRWKISTAAVSCIAAASVFVEAATSRVVCCEEHPKNSQSFNVCP